MLNVNQFLVVGTCTKAKKITAGKWELIFLTVDGVEFNSILPSAEAASIPPEKNIEGKVVRLEGTLDLYEKKGTYQAQMKLGSVGLADKIIDPINTVMISGDVKSKDGSMIEISSAYYYKELKHRLALLDLKNWSERTGISLDNINPGKSSCVVTGKLKTVNDNVVVEVECLSPAKFTKLQKKQS